MRALLFVALGVLLSTVTADARPKRKKRVSITQEVAPKRIEKPKSRAQSIGAPWDGSLKSSTKFRAPERTHLRRPHRAFATRTTVEHTRRAILDTLASFPKLHALAIGDFSAPSGGWISEHSSHQSGRDVDLGLFFKTKPAGYPASFVDADAKTLHVPAMWLFIVNLVNTHDEDGGVHIMFLDFELQGVIYKWAKKNGVSEKRLNQIFQYPYGRGAAAGMIRHEPNHKDHLHVRFKCAAADTACR